MAKYWQRSRRYGSITIVGTPNDSVSRIPPMPNTELTRLMEISALHPDDRPEVERIFACLTEERRIAILSEWPRMAERIKRNREAVEEQKRLLLTNAVSGLAEDLSLYNHAVITRNVRHDLEEFRKSQDATT